MRTDAGGIHMIVNRFISAAGHGSLQAVTMDHWTGVHRAFVIKAYYKNSDSVVIAQKLFKRHFGSHAIPSGSTIKTWVKHFEATGSVSRLAERRPSNQSVGTNSDQEILTAKG